MTSHTSNPSVGDSSTASEWTQQTTFGDLSQQKWLIVGAVCFVGALVLWSMRRRAPAEEAARRLVRDWRHVEDADDVRDLLGSNVPTIVKPALLTALVEIEAQVHQLFRRMEREISRL